MRFQYIFASTVCFASIVSAGLLGTSARADVTVVTETTSEIDLVGVNKSDLGDLGELGKPLTITVAYGKGKLSRYDSQDRIILRGLQDGTITILNPADHTFYVTTESGESSRGGSKPSMVGSALSGVNLNPHISFSPIRTRRTIAGLSAHGHHFDVALDPKFPKGAKDMPDYLRVKVSGEVWASKSLPDLPGEPASSDGQSSTANPISIQLGKFPVDIQGNPLQMTMSLHLEAGDKSNAIKMLLVLRQNVRAVSYAPLSDDTFRVPDGYRLVQAPAKASTAAAAGTTPSPAS